MTDPLRFVDCLQLENGKRPFREWFENLDARTQQIVDASIYKVRRGLRKPVKALKDGVFEIKIDFGPGVRV